MPVAYPGEFVHRETPLLEQRLLLPITFVEVRRESVSQRVCARSGNGEKNEAVPV